MITNGELQILQEAVFAALSEKKDCSDNLDIITNIVEIVVLVINKIELIRPEVDKKKLASRLQDLIVTAIFFEGKNEENKEIVIKKYIEFAKTLGIEKEVKELDLKLP